MEKTDGRRHRGDATRLLVATQVARDATLWGLENTTLGAVSARTGVSKSGIMTVFGSREKVLEAGVAAARDIFLAEVLDPAQDSAPGALRLHAVLDAWLTYAKRHVFPGGCFLVTAGVEYAGQEGPVADRVRAFKREWLDFLSHHFTRAGARDPLAAALHLDALLGGGISTWRLLGEDRVLDVAVAAARDLISSGGAPRGEQNRS